MEINPELPISFATSALKNLLITKINKQEISVADFTVSSDHPNNIKDHGSPILNLYPILISEDAFSKNITHYDKSASMQEYALRLKIHFLLSATGDHTRLVPHILLDSAIKAITANPLIEFKKYNYTMRFVLFPMDTETSTKIWSSLKCSHKINIGVVADTGFKGSTEAPVTDSA